MEGLLSEGVEEGGKWRWCCCELELTRLNEKNVQPRCGRLMHGGEARNNTCHVACCTSGWVHVGVKLHRLACPAFHAMC